MTHPSVKKLGKTGLVRRSDFNFSHEANIDYFTKVATKRGDFSAQHGPVKIIMKDGVLVNQNRSTGNSNDGSTHGPSQDGLVGFPLVESLSDSDIAGLAAFLGLSLFEFERRYK